VWLSIVLSAQLLGCQAVREQTAEESPPDDTYIGWYCKGEKKTDTWVCSQRRLRNGEPVDDVVYAVKRSSDGDAATVAADSAAVADNQDSWQDWKNRLPTLDDTLVAGQAGAAPVPAQKAAATSTAEDTGFSVKVQPGSADDLAGSFTIQLGAFSSIAKRDEFIDQKGLRFLDVQSYEILSRGRSWWILTYGSYHTRDEAIIAWAAISKDYPTVEIWVRSTDSIKNAMPSRIPGK